MSEKSSPLPPPEEIDNQADAARFLGLPTPNPVPDQIAGPVIGTSGKTLRNQRSRGEGPPFIRSGGRVVYTPLALVRFMLRNTVSPGGW